jgi:predicted DNA-binding transcriptional regulator AlpA
MLSSKAAAPAGASLSINEFCQRHGISRATYFAIRKAGFGPTEMRIGRALVRISAAADLEWQRAREHPAGSELAELEHTKVELAARGAKAGSIAVARRR